MEVADGDSVVGGGGRGNDDDATFCFLLLLMMVVVRARNTEDNRQCLIRFCALERETD